MSAQRPKRSHGIATAAVGKIGPVGLMDIPGLDGKGPAVMTAPHSARMVSPPVGVSSR